MSLVRGERDTWPRAYHAQHRNGLYYIAGGNMGRCTLHWDFDRRCWRDSIQPHQAARWYGTEAELEVDWPVAVATRETALAFAALEVS